jgi:hypothetical protein
MSTRLHRLLTLLLILALPVQSWAAAGMVHCAAMHRAQATAAGAHHSHHHQQHATSSHAAPDLPGHAAVSDLSTFKCSACAACCIAAALPATAPAFNVVPASTMPLFFLTVARVQFQTDGPERPPRPFLA